MRIAILAAATLCAGCASTFKVMTDDPVRATNIRESSGDRDALATISLDASRRNVIVGLTDSQFGKFCAEPPPDTASAIQSILEAQANAKAAVAEESVEAAGSLKDSYRSDVVVLAKRTELLDIYRTATYSLCQFYVNGALNGAQVKEIFSAMTNAVIDQANAHPQVVPAKK